MRSGGHRSRRSEPKAAGLDVYGGADSPEGRRCTGDDPGGEAARGVGEPGGRDSGVRGADGCRSCMGAIAPAKKGTVRSTAAKCRFPNLHSF